MRKLLVLRPEAVADLREAYVWYESQRSGMGRTFLRRVKERIALILENPRAYSTVLGSIRRAPLKRFPYGIYFSEQGHRVVNLAVYHFKRSADGWTSRI